MSTVNLTKKTVNLSKGERINLSKHSEGLSKIMVGLGWDPAEQEGQTITETVEPGFFGKLFGAKPRTVTRTVTTGSADTIDCDAWVALLKDGKLKNDTDVVYYGAKVFKDNGDTVIYHHGDNLTGEGEGDDEQITIDLDKVPKKYDSILIGVTIYRGKEKNQSFGGIKNTFVRVVDERNNFEICRFNQAEMADNKDAITFLAGKLFRDKGEWQFKAYGIGNTDDTIFKAANRYNAKDY